MISIDIDQKFAQEMEVAGVEWEIAIVFGSPESPFLPVQFRIICSKNGVQMISKAEDRDQLKASILESLPKLLAAAETKTLPQVTEWVGA